MSTHKSRHNNRELYNVFSRSSTLYDSQRLESTCWTMTVLSPYFIIGVPKTSRSLSSKIIFWSSFSERKKNALEAKFASSLWTMTESKTLIMVRSAILKIYHLERRHSSKFSLTPRYRPVVIWRILIGCNQLMNPPAHLVRANSNRHNDRACKTTSPPS